MKALITSHAFTEVVSLHPQHIMTSWIQAVEEFYLVFDQMAEHAATFATTDNSINYTGQCPQGHVFQLLATMKRQLVYLLNDMDQSSGLSNMAARTVLLKTLSAQTRLSIQLISLSAS